MTAPVSGVVSLTLPTDARRAFLAPRSESGARCAFERAPRLHRARDAGWLVSDLVHVSRFGNPPELSVRLIGFDEEFTLTARWDERAALLERHARRARSKADGGGAVPYDVRRSVGVGA